MSFYYRYNFVPVEPLYALVKEEFRSYFDSTAVDDTLFPLWTNQCLQKLGKASYEIIPAIIKVENYKATLPDDFLSVREAWACTEFHGSYRNPSAIYNTIIDTATRIDNKDVRCNICNECENPPVIQAIYKVTNQVLYSYKQQYLLKPGIINNITCPQDLYCANYNSASVNTYDIKGNKFLTTLKEATIYLLYYSEQFDEDNNLLIPDTYRIKEFIKAFLKQKIIEQVFNQTSDESFNQVKYKLDRYKQEADEAYILADTDNKKEDIHRSIRAVKRVQNRFKYYDIK